eukprot:7370270-Pyramimonas_sp.AAC.1
MGIRGNKETTRDLSHVSAAVMPTGAGDVQVQAGGERLDAELGVLLEGPAEHEVGEVVPNREQL